MDDPYNPTNITVDDVKQGVSAVQRPVLEGGGLTAGGMLGSATGNPLMTLLGSGMGYSMGANAADRVDELLGMKQPMSLQDIATKSVTDIPTGAAYEAGGQIIGKAIPPVMAAVKKGGKWVFEKTNAQALLKHITRPAAQREAAAILAENSGRDAIFVKNMKEAEELMAEIPGLKLSLGQKTGDPGIIKLERVQMRSPGTAAETVELTKADNTEALRQYYNKKFGADEGIDEAQTLLQSKKDLLESTADTMKSRVNRQARSMEQVEPQETGKRIVKEIEAEEVPIKKAMGELKKKTPDYPMEFKNTAESLNKILSDRTISPGVKKPVLDFKKEFEEMVKAGKSTFTATGIRRAINEMRSKLYKAGDKWSADLLGDVKKGLLADLEEVGKQARTGKIGEYNGRVVDTDQLAGQLEKDTVRLAELGKSQKPDIQLMKKELNDAGYPTLQVVAEGDEAYIQRIQQDYTRKIGKEPPLTSDKYQDKIIKELEDRIAQNKEILSKVSPGQDVAASVKAYNDFASTEYFGRFNTPSVKLPNKKG
jgi:hypothetical protein